MLNKEHIDSLVDDNRTLINININSKIIIQNIIK